MTLFCTQKAWMSMETAPPSRTKCICHQSSSLLSSSSSSSSDAMSLGSTDDNDDSIYLASMFTMRELLEAILKTQVISPNEVVKCSQLILVLEIYVYHLTPLTNWSSESRTTRHSKITLT